ncbi:phospholipid/cholesterol/gamma-HCH transport system substrate-binding protein [Actinocorallia herbida]|uniref:Phospholipid/cholesterol/gamma-HCH transport system substrate-binding protein n=1 Tax=Actinocorallia herbida TaxID=58109 RepID=A0A3N1DCE0_9ACTN|nr:MlaD family protein [Actinocorallia herbida]ROO91192.1 phospholipid/cholesterol/gamma-HCH transport system substrate-binding protein [Actinocorallia herbida]
MILKRGVKIQLVVFLIVTVLGVSYTLVRYVGVGGGLFNQTYKAYVQIPDSGGAFTNSEVTYQGVPVGKVGPIDLVEGGVKIELVIDKGYRIPRDTVAVVANRSAVGEQYIDLQPRSDKAPYLDEGAPYTITDARVPVKTADLLRNLDNTVTSVNVDDLQTIVDELDLAFNGAGGDLQSILDDSGKIIKEADENFETTSRLLDSGGTFLDSQRDNGGAIQTFARNLALLTDSIREDDPSIRADIDAVEPAVDQADALIDGLSDDLPVLLANLTSTGQVLTARQDGIRSMLIMFPFTVAGAQTVMPGDGYQHFGLALNIDDPAPCTAGYEKTDPRWPQQTKDLPARTDIGCTSKDKSVSVRGSKNTPKPRPNVALPPGALDGAGEPPAASTRQNVSDDDEDIVYQTNSSNSVFVTGYDPTSGKYTGPDGVTYTIGSSGGAQNLLGEESWKWLLLGPLS